MSGITPQTRFRRFNFTLYENLDTFTRCMDKLFKRDDNPFEYFIFWIGSNFGQRCVEGYAEVDLMRLGYYNDRRKSGIKGIMQSNFLHVEFAYGTREECIDFFTNENWKKSGEFVRIKQ